MENKPWTKDQHPQYLGDGVYAWDDGFQVWIGTPRGDNWETIALEAYTFQALINYQAERKSARG